MERMQATAELETAAFKKPRAPTKTASPSSKRVGKPRAPPKAKSGAKPRAKPRPRAKPKPKPSPKPTASARKTVVRVTPVLRWRCARLLAACLGVEGHHSMRCRNPREVGYCRRVERLVYFFSDGNMQRYQDRIEQLVGALRRNGAKLAEAHDPRRLVSLDDEALGVARRPPTEDEVEAAEREEVCRRMMAEKVYEPDDGIDGVAKAITRCFKCKGTDVFSDSLQIRAADEGPTVFCMCNNKDCGHRWRLSN